MTFPKSCHIYTPNTSNCNVLYSKNFGGTKVWQIWTVGNLVENFGKLKYICIGNVMEIMKIGDKTWRNAVIRQSFLTANVFYCIVCTRVLIYCICMSRSKGTTILQLP